MIETKRTIVLHDGERVELPLKKDQQIWAVELRIKPVESNTGEVTQRYTAVAKTVHVKRELLESCGLVGNKPDPPRPEEPQTLEDLLLKVLHHVGVFPEE